MQKITFLFILLLLPMMGFSSSHNDGERNELIIQEGVASYYGKRFHLRKTANGEVFNMEEMTAAHKNLPFGTMLKVTNLNNGKAVWVRINDRLPQSSKRSIDLSRGAAKKLDMIQDGIVKVKMEVPDQETVLALMEHYQNEKPEDIRLRVFEEPIDIKRSEVSLLDLKIELLQNITAGLSR
ncbi:MAG: septal ring lytic transglycosylase RlpA family protein [Mongoliibacter sp.]|uniref:septal ring lytic transglycosylase RlpA family protein n=1 Tax=Mongoliibacter sp. TaxID=2022438 RepID=UPI0012EFFC4D|nr:septal ring lytic transglycosylase RlpA family protein [Mongoliibacter sp.]TVP52101.1 MAG: septal ring lytic transglycosylase RlpA family protein [Mongoliibacter sp.]